MAQYSTRTITGDDFTALMELEDRLFGGCEDGVLGPYYIRLCCDFFADTCFVIEADGAAVGYLLAFVRDRQAYCTSLGLLSEHQGTRALVGLLAAFVDAILGRVDTCWFTVEADNRATRSIHAILGACEERFEPDFYGAGRGRIISRIDRASFERVAPRLARLGIARARPSAVSEAVA